MMKKNTDNSEQSQENMIFGVPKKLFIGGCVIIAVLLIAAALVTSLLNKFGREESAAKYPASTLSHEASKEHKFIESEVLSKTLGCPSLPYNINVPDSIVTSTKDYVIFECGNCRVVLLESEEDTMSALNGTLGEVCVTSIDVPTVEWKDELSDVGYFNGYSAEYHAGYFKITNKLSSSVFYGVSYCITFEDTDKAIYIEATSTELSDLSNGKDVIDSMLYTLVSLQTESAIEDATEEVTTEITTESPEYGEEIEFMETKPTDLYSKDFELYVPEDMSDLYIVFMWENVTTAPSILNVTDPNGKVYDFDEDISSDGLDVFYVPEAVAGTYIIHGEVAGTMYGCTYEALSKEAFYMTYLNMDVDGEPAAYFDENDFPEDDSYDEDYDDYDDEEDYDDYDDEEDYDDYDDEEDYEE